MHQTTSSLQTNRQICQSLVVTVWIAILVAGGELAAQSPDRGQEIFVQHCVQCHGARNEGVAGQFDHPIAGPATREELGSFIEQTMPVGNPELVAGEDAGRVADFILRNFLAGPEQAAPPRIELSHLTVTQYENSLADIFAGLVGTTRPETAGGLSAEYRNSREFWKSDPLLARTDSRIRFDFGEASPDAEKIQAEEFSIVWSGSIFAPETGTYEFVVDTPNGFKLHVNNDDVPLIDGWVSTPEAPRHSATIKLLGGRWYRIYLPYHKFKDPVAAIQLGWRLPGARTVSEIPPGYLSGQWVQRVFVVETHFPPDDSSTGYPRGTLVSREWDEATSAAAIETADFVLEGFEKLVGTPPGSETAGAGAREFCAKFASAAFRKPLSDEEKQLYISDFFDTAGSPALQLKRSLMAILKSPRFLYPELVAPANPGRLRANRISLFLTDSIPDNPQLQSAWSGGLQTREQVLEHSRRLLDDPRSRAKIRQFFVEWLEMDAAAEVSKDPDRFAGFDDALVGDLKTSLQLFVDHTVWEGQGDFRQLFLSSEIWMNARMKKFYAIDTAAEAGEAEAAAAESGEAKSAAAESGVAGSGADETLSGDLFQPVSMDSAERAGLLTHPLLLSKLAYFRSTSPIHRGVFVSRRLLGWQLKPPPVAVDPLGEDYDLAMTTRQRVEFQTRADNCMSCHRVINPLGFALERLDAVGRARDSDNAHPVDTHVIHYAANGQPHELNGPRDLAEYLVGERETYRNFVESIFQHLVKQPVAAYGDDLADRLTGDFMKNGCNVRELILDIVAEAAVFETKKE